MQKHRQVFLRGCSWFFENSNLCQNPHLLSLSTDQISHSFISKLFVCLFGVFVCSLICVSLSFWRPVVQHVLLSNTSSQPLQANVGSWHNWKCGKGHQLLHEIPCDPLLCSATSHRKGLCQGEGMSGTIEMVTQQVKQAIVLLLMGMCTAWRGHSLLKEINKAGWTITVCLRKLPRSLTNVPLLSNS